MIWAVKEINILGSGEVNCYIDLFKNMEDGQRKMAEDSCSHKKENNAREISHTEDKVILEDDNENKYVLELEYLQVK